MIHQINRYQRGYSVYISIVLIFFLWQVLLARDHSGLLERFDDYSYLSGTEVIGYLWADDQIYTLDLLTGEEVLWEQSWSPDPGGWQTGGIWDVEVSPDGQWVLVARVLWVSASVDYFIPGYEAVGLILSRNDGSDAQCVALGLSPAGGSVAVYSFTSDSRFITGNNICTEYMSPEDFSAAFDMDNGILFDPDFRNTVRFFDLETMSLRSMPFDTDGGKAIYPDMNSCYIKCPWNDTALFYEVEGGSPPVHYQFRSVSMAGPVVEFEISPESDGYSWPVLWVFEEGVLFMLGGSLGILGTNAEFTPLPDSVSSWQFLHMLPDRTCLFRRGDGQPLERAEFDWDDFEVLESIVLEE